MRCSVGGTNTSAKMLKRNEEAATRVGEKKKFKPNSGVMRWDLISWLIH